MRKTRSGDVLDTVAKAKGVEPLELPPLTDVVDPDALEALVGTERSPNHRTNKCIVTFCYAGRRVIVQADGTTVALPTDRPWSERSDCVPPE